MTRTMATMTEAKETKARKVTTRPGQITWTNDQDEQPVWWMRRRTTTKMMTTTMMKDGG